MYARIAAFLVAVTSVAAPWLALAQPGPPPLTAFPAPPIVQASVCLTHETGVGRWNSKGEMAWERFRSVISTVEGLPTSITVKVDPKNLRPTTLDEDATSISTALGLAAQRSGVIAKALAWSRPDFNGLPVATHVSDVGNYAGAECHSSVSLRFPASMQPQFCPASKSAACLVACDAIACERR